jgi:hypothetical protein
MKMMNNLTTLWNDAQKGLRLMPPDLRHRILRNMCVAGVCTVISSGLIVQSLMKSPRDTWTAAINAGILAGIGYYVTKTTRPLIAVAGLGRSFEKLEQEGKDLEQLQHPKGGSGNAPNDLRLG